MKHIVILSIMMFNSCQVETKHMEAKINVPASNTGIDSCSADNFTPDMYINKVKLSDPFSVTKELGDLKEIIKQDKESLPYVEFLNKEKTEKLTAFFFYGSGYDEIYQFKLASTTGKSPNAIRVLEYDNFKTESGIGLGISEEYLISIKGNNFVKTKNILKYSISDFNNSCFLNKYNLPIYFSEYTFSNDKLVTIYFGFEYP